MVQCYIFLGRYIFSTLLFAYICSEKKQLFTKEDEEWFKFYFWLADALSALWLAQNWLTKNSADL